MPDYETLETLYNETRHYQLRLHGKEPTPMDQQVSNIILEATIKAIENVTSNNTEILVQAVPLATGLGKTTATCALIATLAKFDPKFSTVVATPTAKLAEEIQHLIEQILGVGSTFLWTSYHAHDADPVMAEAELGHPVLRPTNKADLPNSRIAIITHRQLQSEMLIGTDQGALSFQGRARSVCFCDENPDFVPQVSCDERQILNLHQIWAQQVPQHPWLPIISNLVTKLLVLTREQELTKDEKSIFKQGMHSA